MHTFDVEASLEARHRQNAYGTMKIKEDLEQYKKIIEEMKPGIIIEFGTFSGKSALWFAQVSGKPVVTVDTDARNIERSSRKGWAGWVQFIEGSSTDADVMERVHYLAWKRNPLLVLDSDHAAHHVLSEMLAYQDMVEPGGWMVVEDTLLRWMPEDEQCYEGTPMDAVDVFMEFARGWEQHAHHPVTQHPGGWLRRTS